jgi:hypothetical protein
MGDGNTIEDFVELRGVYGLTSVIGANNTFADNILFNTNGNSLTIGEGNNFKKSSITLPAPSDGTIRFSPGTTASRLGQDIVINTELLV